MPYFPASPRQALDFPSTLARNPGAQDASAGVESQRRIPLEIQNGYPYVFNGDGLFAVLTFHYRTMKGGFENVSVDVSK
jgi:hypothetical protein